MNALDALLGSPLVALFATVFLGMLLGNVKLGGVSLGSSGVLFVALVMGHLGYGVPVGVGDLGLVLFVYCVGLTAGPSFFQALMHHGKSLVKLGALIVLAGAATTWCFAYFANIPGDLAAGIFAGAMTSTPALAAALDILGDQGAYASIGYGLAYPFGVIGVVLFVQLLPKLMRMDTQQAAAEGAAHKRPAIGRALVEVVNPALDGKSIDDATFLADAGCQVSRVLANHESNGGARLVPIASDFRFKLGQHVLIVGPEDRLDMLIAFIGRRSQVQALMDTEHERTRVVVTSAKLVGQSLRELHLLRNYGIVVSRINRLGIDFVPRGDTVIQAGDVLTAVGEATKLQAFAVAAGHRARAVDETDLVSLALGITLGIVVGTIPLSLPGTRGFSLGLAGGPLLVGLLLGHFGRVGKVVGYVPRAASYVLTEVGLVLFLASAGVSAGGQIVAVFREHGVILITMGVAVTTVPMIVGFLYARRRLKLSLIESLGGVCGGMTSTPGLGAITAKTDSDTPVVCYATAYPMALLLMTIFAQVLLSLLQSATVQP